MTQDSRNTRVTIFLILSMTLGAAILMWLSPRPATPELYPMDAQRAGTLDGAVIAYVPTQAFPAEGTYDCLFRPDGTYDWSPRAGVREARLVLVGDAGPQLLDRLPDALPAAQAHALLIVLQKLQESAQVDVSSRVRLEPTSDARRRPDLPRAAHDLRQLLAMKQLVR